MKQIFQLLLIPPCQYNRKYIHFLLDNRNSLINALTLSTLGKIFSRWHFEIFFLFFFFWEKRFYHSADYISFPLGSLGPLWNLWKWSSAHVYARGRKQCCNFHCCLWRVSIKPRLHFLICSVFFVSKGNLFDVCIDISCKLSPMETICIKCSILFSGKKNKKKNVINLLSAKLAQRVVNLKPFSYLSKSGAGTFDLGKNRM